MLRQRAWREVNDAPPPGSDPTAVTAHDFTAAPCARHHPYPFHCLAASTLPPYATGWKGKCLFPSRTNHAAPLLSLYRGTATAPAAMLASVHRLA
jgi:hypothetical protein